MAKVLAADNGCSFMIWLLHSSSGLFLGIVPLSNVTLLEVNSARRKIDCISPDGVPVGQWYYPSGNIVPEGSSPPVYAVYREVARKAELVVQNSLTEEGIYACMIKDNGVILYSYFIGLHNSINKG